MFIEFVEEQILLFVAMAVIVAMLIWSYVGDSISGINNIGTDEAVRVYNQDAKLLDVRSDGEYKTGFIGEATLVTPTEIEQTMKNLANQKDQPILVYCQSGMRSASVAKKLVKNGFSNVYNLKGGIAAWKSAGLPVNKPVSKKKQKRQKA
ncbi:rhodanese-like domain-containing protein [Hydrogenovibrio halophilus]|uniref:rhodanese-like domain-containing protein n=1 Tax=Hydrogenovibrio halophilus TaxID=373391 RepID=UPI0003687900|nr:rhodanese-like domain-containing protein [Hydrogenovibrio halophilus]